MTYHAAKYDQQNKIRHAFYFIVCFLTLTTQISLASAGIRADFNGDGFEDLVVGVPGEDIVDVKDAGVVQIFKDAGAVQIFYGNAAGTISDSQNWTLNSPGIQLSPGGGDRFGSAVTQGDFNGDGYADLAVGIPFKDNKKGQVLVLYGSITGLTATGYQIWDQDNLADMREAGDQFGSALTSGDFNGDGYSDLAIGVPKEDFPDIGPPATEIPKCGICADAGIVHVVYGSPAGLNAAGNELWHQDRGIGYDGWVEWQDCFGASLESGDFNGDGADDLAVGAPCEHTGGADVVGRNNGAVSVYYGTPGLGLTGRGAKYLRQWHDKVVGFPQANDAFGFALAVGDFNNDNYDDLAIGVPGEEVDCNSATDAGAVAVFYGSSGAGIAYDASRNELWCRNTEGIQGYGRGRWGYSVATGDFDADGFDDVAIGAPTDELDGVIDAGSVTILYGSSSRLTSMGNQFFSQNSSGMNDVAEPYDWFGHTLTTVDFNGDGISDLAIGVPFDNVSDVINAGAVNLLLGEEINGLSTIDAQFFHQNYMGAIDWNETDDQFGGRLVPQLYQSRWPNKPPEGPTSTQSAPIVQLKARNQ